MLELLQHFNEAPVLLKGVAVIAAAAILFWIIKLIRTATKMLTKIIYIAIATTLGGSQVMMLSSALGWLDQWLK